MLNFLLRLLLRIVAVSCFYCFYSIDWPEASILNSCDSHFSTTSNKNSRPFHHKFLLILSNFAFLVEMSAGFSLVGTYVHSTSWKYSAWKKFGLYFLYIFIADRNFLTNFCSSDPSFNGNILISLYLKSETSVLAQLCDYMFIHTIYKFHGMVLAGNLN